MATRETILDAAALVMREKGLARATTKEIARAAGYSEALLYKYFADKQEIYLAVLHERAGGLTDARELVGTATVRDNLVGLVLRLMEFYVASFPMSASIFSDRELLAHWRQSIEGKGGGPRWPIRALQGYLDGELGGGRIRLGTEVAPIAALLCGAAFQSAFLACFEGLDKVPRARVLAADLVDAALGDAALADGAHGGAAEG